MDNFDFSQKFNDVRYYCNDCETSWNSLDFLNEFESNYQDYDGFVKGDWHKIKRSIFENLFRPNNRQISIVCPKCSLNDKQSGNISVNVIGDKTNQSRLQSVYNENNHAFEQATSKLWHVNKEVNSEGVVVQSD